VILDGKPLAEHEKPTVLRTKPKASHIKPKALNLQSNDFALFNLPLCFAQNRAAIDARWKELQREAHPDKFSAQGTAAQRIAMQWSVRINEAYQRLKAPLQRAAYLCELHQAPVNAENNTAMPAAFLMQQIELHEALEEATTEEDLDKLSLQINEIEHKQLSEIEHLLDAQQNYPQAAEAVRALMFTARFRRGVQARYEALGQ
jgi:molecular chaperone HscB